MRVLQNQKDYYTPHPFPEGYDDGARCLRICLPSVHKFTFPKLPMMGHSRQGAGQTFREFSVVFIDPLNESRFVRMFLGTIFRLSNFRQSPNKKQSA